MVDNVSASHLPRKQRYELADIADLVIELHGCVEKAAVDIAGVRSDLSDHRLEVVKEIGAVGERVAKLEGKSEAIGQRVGVDERANTQKAVWFPRPWQIIGGICAGAGGFVIIYQIAWPVLEALHHAIMAHH